MRNVSSPKFLSSWKKLFGMKLSHRFILISQLPFPINRWSRGEEPLCKMYLLSRGRSKFGFPNSMTLPPVLQDTIAVHRNWRNHRKAHFFPDEDAPESSEKLVLSTLVVLELGLGFPRLVEESDQVQTNVGESDFKPMAERLLWIQDKCMSSLVW